MKSLHVSELTPEQIEKIKNAKAPLESDALNYLMEE